MGRVAEVLVLRLSSLSEFDPDECAVLHSGPAKSLIYAVFRLCYTGLVQERTSPAPPGSQKRNKLKVCVMSLAKLDRFVPTFLLFLGFVAAGGTAVLGV